VKKTPVDLRRRHQR